MCGIAGIVAAGNVPAASVEPMLDALRHRGPDGSGAWCDAHCALGHRRLSIIDLTDAARQPLSNEAGDVWLSFNGEIYNHRDLRKTLERLGHRFRSATDAEVVVHGYEEWGTASLARLRGMFAFGLWDQRRQRLWAARDRIGKKPFFYAPHAGFLVFASEVRSLLAFPGLRREVDFEAIDHYLSWGYVPAPFTAFRGIRKLPPAHALVVEAGGDALVIREEPYWSAPTAGNARLAESAATEALRQTLDDAVRLRMQSDVPLGAFLSGGVDSAVVVALMARHSPGPVKTFTIGFGDPVYDERDAARRVSQRWGTDHTEFVVEPDALAVLPTLVRHFGEPFADSSAVPTYYVAKATRASVTVALSGDGGDENFAGYERYRAQRLAARFDRIGPLKPIARLAARPLRSAPSRSPAYRAARFLAGIGADPVARYGAWVGGSTGHLSLADKRALCTPEFAASLGCPASEWLQSLFRSTGHLDPINQLIAVDFASYLPYDLLVKADITSMANGLEVRAPFLDQEVIELAARLPGQLKLHGTTGKFLVKRAFADLIPAGNRALPKRGFGAPVGQWLRGCLRPMLQDVLLSARASERGYFVPEAVRRLVTDHLEGRADLGYRLWSLLMLELWHVEFIDHPGGY